MARSAQRINLSGSTDGKGIKLTATATPGNAIHTATSSSTPGAGGTWDEIWLWAYNAGTSTVVLLTIEFGGATAPDQNITIQIPNRAGIYLVLGGLILQNSATVKAFCSTVNNIEVSGFVNRMSQ